MTGYDIILPSLASKGLITNGALFISFWLNKI